MTPAEGGPPPQGREQAVGSGPQTGPDVGVEQSAEQTRDDTDAGWGEEPRVGSRGAVSSGMGPSGGPPDPHDQWLLEQRPPHWD